jgi:hypothetical protein
MIKQQEQTNSELINAFNLKEDEVFDVKFNLLGLFETLNDIDQRLKGESDS